MSDDTITPKDLYKELWHCRDFEINHLWQRSVFLATFMLAIVAAYGTMVGKIIFTDNGTAKVYEYTQSEDAVTKDKYIVKLDSEQNTNSNLFAVQHFVATGLCYLGLCFSILWIMMAKGSKYFYESIEESMRDFIGRSKKCGVWDIPPGYPEYSFLNEPLKTKSSIFSPKGYKYSPSKINCCIGTIGMICWLVLSIIHLGKAIEIYWGLSKLVSAFSAIGVSFLVFVTLYAFLALFCKSGD